MVSDGVTRVIRSIGKDAAVRDWPTPDGGFCMIDAKHHSFGAFSQYRPITHSKFKKLLREREEPGKLVGETVDFLKGVS